MMNVLYPEGGAPCFQSLAFELMVQLYIEKVVPSFCKLLLDGVIYELASGFYGKWPHSYLLCCLVDLLGRLILCFVTFTHVDQAFHKPWNSGTT